MAFSYSGNPASSNLDYVRFCIGDTNSTTFFLHDAEIEMLIAQNANKWIAAAKAAESVAAYFARNVDTRAGQTSVSKSDRFKHYMELAASLRLEAAKSGAAGVYAGGQSIAERDTDEADTDLIQPVFTRNFDRHPDNTDTGEAA